jgi:hypothetical protein
MSSLIDNAYRRSEARREEQRRNSFDFTDEFGVDPVRARYPISSRDVERAAKAKEYELNVLNAEASVVGQQLRNVSLAAEEAYKARQRMETDAQLTDAYGALGNVNDVQSLLEIGRTYSAAYRDEAFKASYDEKKQLLETRSKMALEAAKYGVYPEYRDSAAAAGSPEEAVAQAVSERESLVSQGTLRGSGYEVPRNPDGSVDRQQLAILRAEQEASTLQQEERRYLLDKWRSLSERKFDPVKQAVEPWSEADDEELRSLENLLDPRRRAAGNNRAGGAATGGSSSTDDYLNDFTGRME